MLTRAELTDSVLKGALNAARQYVEWSGGATIHDSGIEMFVSTEVAREIIARWHLKDERHWIRLEVPFNQVQMECVGTLRRGRRRKLFEGKPRVDVVYYSNRGSLRGAIEVKRSLSFHNLEKDIRRVLGLLQECGGDKGCLRFGCVVGLREINDRRRKAAETVMGDILEKARALPDAQGTNGSFQSREIELDEPIRYPVNGTEYVITAFLAGCLIFSLRRGV